MVTPDFFANLLKEFGITAALIILTIWFVYTRIFPTMLDRWRKEAEERDRREAQHREFLLEEIKELRIDAKVDKEKMYAAFDRNTQAFHDLQNMIESVRNELSQLRHEVGTVQGDVKEVYLIVGTRKGLIERGRE